MPDAGAASQVKRTPDFGRYLPELPRSETRRRLIGGGLLALTLCALALATLLLSASPPPAQAQAGPNKLWESNMAVGSGTAGIGYFRHTSLGFGSLSPDDAFQWSATPTVDRKVNTLVIGTSNNALELKLNGYPTPYSGVLCADGAPFAFDQNNFNAGPGNHTWSGHGLSWSNGQQVRLSIWEVPALPAGYQNSDYAYLCAAALPAGALWKAEITPAQHSNSSFSHITGWSGGDYGSISGGNTFVEGSTTFTVRWVAHNSTSTAMLLRIGRSSSATFAAATLCAGDLSVPYRYADRGGYRH